MKGVIKEYIEKPWGYEEVLVDSKHGLKRLVIEADEETSLHYHKEKNETFFIEAGRCFVTVDGKDYHLCVGDYLFIPNGVKHRIKALDAGVSIIEFGHPHDNTDVVRVEDPYEDERK